MSDVGIGKSYIASGNFVETLRNHTSLMFLNLLTKNLLMLSEWIKLPIFFYILTNSILLLVYLQLTLTVDLYRQTEVWPATTFKM